MLGCYDFCAHYEWTFAWLDRNGGEECVRTYWDDCISKDSQRHAEKLIGEKGFAGMSEYWGHALVEEAAGYTTTEAEGLYRIDMNDCPSKGFLIRNGLEQYHDYCDHCLGWIAPLLARHGYVAMHQHNHRGQCWWEIRRKSDPTAPSGPGEIVGEKDVRLRPDWKDPQKPIDSFRGDLDSPGPL
jgi:hypothetical protein